MKEKIDIFFVGGGTAGHVLPNVFIINELLKRKTNLKIGYIGSKESIEKKIFEENFPDKSYFEISSDKLRRYITYKHIFAPFKIIKGFFDAFLILKKHKPKLIFAKGGFVCAPVVLAAALLKIKIFIHESDYSIGLTNKISMPFASKIGVSFQKTIESNQKFAKKMKLFGPIFNKKILENKDDQIDFSEKIQKWQNQTDNDSGKKILLILGGSLGSKIINDLIYENHKALLKDFKIIHICGKGNVDQKIQHHSESDENFNYVLFESLPHEDLIKLIKLSDIVVSRAGINTVFELIFFKKLVVFIPLSAKNSRGDQIENAEYFFSKGVCEIIREEKLSSITLFDKLSILSSKQISDVYKENLEKINLKLGTDEISDEILEMI